MKPRSKHADRAAGWFVGAFIGDALDPGPHWYSDTGALRRDFGPWTDGYTAPRLVSKACGATSTIG